MTEVFNSLVQWVVSRPPATLVFIASSSAVVLVVGVYFFRRLIVLSAAKPDPIIGRHSPAERLAGPEPAAEPALGVAPGPAVEPAADLRSVLAKTREAFGRKLENLVLGAKKIDDSFIDGLEELLYTSDLGPKTVQKLLDAAKLKLARGELSNLESIKASLQKEILAILEATKQNLFGSKLEWVSAPKPWVILVVGINGVGKTTSIGKLAHFFASQSKKVLIVAGDTFRAAAGEQLTRWAERAQVEVFNSAKTTEPAAVAFEGVQKALAENFDVVIVDTAGRLHTKENLMEELKKVKRVMTKALAGAPHETILVLDAGSGQNALVQARQFNEAVGVTSLIVTKLDGTARGGMIVGIASELGLAVQYIGLGEKLTDLKVFSTQEYARVLLDSPPV